MPLKLISEGVREEGAQLTLIDNRGNKRKGNSCMSLLKPQQPPALKQS
jgi:hypothetical protein